MAASTKYILAAVTASKKMAAIVEKELSEYSIIIKGQQIIKMATEMATKMIWKNCHFSRDVAIVAIVAIFFKVRIK